MKKILFFCLLAINLGLYSCGDNSTYVKIETRMGDMKVKLYNSTPKHRDNFIKLAKEGFFDDLLFHRVIKGFMVQGGDPDSKGAQPGRPLGMGGPGYTLDAEIGAPHVKGALAAARLPDGQNPEKKSSGSQFFIVQGTPLTAAQIDQMEQQKGVKYPPEVRELYMTLGGSPFLDMEYSVFGEVVEGMDVIDKIANTAVNKPGDRPKEDIKMKVTVL